MACTSKTGTLLERMNSRERTLGDSGWVGQAQTVTGLNGFRNRRRFSPNPPKDVAMPVRQGMRGKGERR